MKKISYADAGVSIEAGNRAVELMKEAVSATHIPGVLGQIGSFSGGFSLAAFQNLQDPVLLAATDGVGTKLLLGQQTGRTERLGEDLVAMCVNDLICQGARPLFFLDYIASGRVVPEAIQNLVESIARGCQIAGCALIGGETAEMPGLYDPEEFDLAGFAVGIAERAKMLSPARVQAGDALIGLASSGFHSNGYSLLRKLFANQDLTQKPLADGKTLAELLMEPTRIYVKEALALMERFEVRGLAHITGGGLTENVPRMLPPGLDALLDSRSWQRPQIVRIVQELGMVEEEELFRSFNMGIGLVAAVPREQSADILAHLQDAAVQAWRIGQVQKGAPGLSKVIRL